MTKVYPPRAGLPAYGRFWPLPISEALALAEALASSSPSVSRNIEKGEFILDNNKELKIEFPVT
jgi:hypothetical protein